MVNVEQGRAVERSRCSKLIDSDVELRKRMPLRVGQPNQDWKDNPASMVLKKPNSAENLRKTEENPENWPEVWARGSHHVAFVHLTGVNW